MSANNDGSESVDHFLARIASIQEGKSDPNAASRRMDEEFLKGRQERQARRLERARSISPSKTGPARPLSLATNTFDSIATPEQVLNPPIDFSSQSKSLSRANAVSGRSSPVKEVESLPDRPVSQSSKKDEVQPTASGLARSGTLSWQQRPSQRDGPRQRPLSGIAMVRGVSKEPEETDKNDMTRTEIAASLASKDPTWFRQTQDRATGSAAFRKNQIEDAPQPLLSRSMQLPGMTRSREPSKSPAPEVKEDSRPGSAQSPSNRDSPRFARGTTPDIAALRESMVEKPPSLRPSSQDTFSSRPTSADTFGLDDSNVNLARSSSTFAQNRPLSPTKGLGGFVESAMMKRSDSMNKRWSVRSNTGLVRGDSAREAKSRSLHSRGLSRDVTAPRADLPSSPLTSPRPGSSHSQQPDLTPIPPGGSDTATHDTIESKETVRTDAQQASSKISRSQTPTDDDLLARSPSKTMDPRRWSPTKSTWLESALQQKSEPPKMQPLKEEQPKWKVDLQRSRSRVSRDISPEKKVPTEASLMSNPSTVSKPESPKAMKVAPPATQREPVEREVTSPSTSPPPMPKSEKDQSDVKEVEPKPERLVKPTFAPVTEPKEKIQQKDVPPTVKQAPIVKPKPQTPPKTDFRATLKSRTAGPAQSASSEPEFKSMFGKLKRTTTQNYVAPDELKTNILTGKAALNVTEGPVKTKRTDEFKESILATKEAMKNSRPTTSVELKEKEEAPIPEALARRKTLSKANAPDLASLRKKPETKPDLPSKPITSTYTKSASKVAEHIPATIATKVNLPKIPSPTLPTQSSMAEKVEANVAEGSKPPSSPKVDSRRADINLATTSRSTASSTTEPMSEIRSQTPQIAPTPKQPSVIQDSASATQSQSSVAGKLASRLNPNLAAMLSRGPSPKPSSVVENNSVEVSERDASSDDTGLVHMTKARAKGPKRRAPKAEPIKESEQTKTATGKPAELSKSSPPETRSRPLPTKPVREVPLINKEIESPQARLLSSVEKVPQPVTPSKQPANNDVPSVKADAPASEKRSSSSLEKPKPPIANKSSELRKVSGSANASTKIVSDSRPDALFQKTLVPTTSILESSKDKKAQEPEKVKTALSPGKPTMGKSSSKNFTRSEINKAQLSTVQGLGLQMSPSPKARKPSLPHRMLTPPPDEDIDKPDPVTRSDIKPILEKYMGPFPNERERAEFDSQQFLKGISQKQVKVTTEQHSIVEVSGDGKRTPLPSHQQHILYEEAMYLTTHKFSADGGAPVSEVQLWCGDRVSDAAVEDAQIFCRRTAREHSVKLEVVKQGKESLAFIAGLGGILIIRRSKSSAIYMLCGRQHLGHIVFDEVDMICQNLCPGYAYLVSAPYGKLFLWKGKGASVDEIGSARLVGSDLDLTGEIEEVEQGQEPALFWEAVGKTTATQYALDWHNRSAGKGYPAALYRIDHERPGMLTNLASWGLKRAASPAKQQIKATCEHIQPFTQNDLDHSAVHILDAYWALYIIVTRRCVSKAAEFITSLHLAQDFAMLSPAIQDRPVLPVCYVVAGELPHDVKTCFRKWSNIEGNSLAGSDSICVRLEEVMGVFDL